MTRGEAILVVAGEPSGDRALAGIVRALDRPAIGIGGDALAAAGAELVAHVRALSGMGTFELAERVPAIARALLELRRAVKSGRAKTALLASWSAGNARLAPMLRRAGLRVAWVSPPEVWAWRAGRAPSLARAVDLMIPTLPFEEALWRDAGANARFVGHPIVDALPQEATKERARLRGELGLSYTATTLALLPGSRPAEIARLLDPFLGAALRLEADARVVIAPNLDEESRARIRDGAARARIAVIEAPADRGASALLPAFDLALVASGTASLEAAACGVPPVIAYALHPLTMAIAKRVVRTEHFALPNVLLDKSGARAPFHERLQEDVRPATLAAALAATLADTSTREACARIRALLTPASAEGTFSERAAHLVAGLY